MMLKSLPCGLVAGKSLMLMAIVVEKLFRLSNGQSAILYLINPNIRTVMPLGCVSCVPLLRAKEETVWLAKLAKSSHEATADGLSGSISAEITKRINATITTERSTVLCAKPKPI